MDETERRLSRLEAALSALPRLESKLDVVVDMTTALKVLEERQADQVTSLSGMSRRAEAYGQRLGDIETDLASKYAWARGAVLTATLFWVVLQGSVAYILKNTLDTVAENNEAVIQIKQHHKDRGWPSLTPPPKS